MLTMFLPLSNEENIQVSETNTWELGRSNWDRRNTLILRLTRRTLPMLYGLRLNEM